MPSENVQFKCNTPLSLIESNSSAQFNYMRDAELVNAVRKDLAMALKELFQHGLVWVSKWFELNFSKIATNSWTV